MRTNVQWEPVISSAEEMPADIDTTSSAFVVYIRKDIVPYEEFDDQGQQTFKGWKYLECKVDNADWIADQLAEQVKVNEQLKTETQELKDQNEALMMGLVDLYEMNLGV